MTDELGSALAEEATKKAGIVWITVPGHRAVAIWHVWHADALYFVIGGLEQRVPELVPLSRVLVTVPSKDKGGRLITWVGVPHRVEAGTDEWQAATAALHAQRLNPPDGETQPERWAREAQIWRLEPTGEIVDQPGNMPTGSHAAPPPATPATTRGPLPYVFGRRHS